ncbi:MULTISPECIES: hypothetical protein [unclassified Frankia]|uniref:hypothetical protein n=1 Tax=unclassified Frankia TaxID=2632575 RepID=UPI001EF4DDB3|nr:MULTISPECIES: hypothetical protein [unclassified Frankia]
MRTRVQVPIVALLWFVVGIIVALSKSYEVHNTSQLVTFVLTVALWPIPVLGGTLTVQF